jgi:tetratricopeptide (TPR) repeat protein
MSKLTSFDHFERKEYEKSLSELNLTSNKNHTNVKHNILIVNYFLKKISPQTLLEELESFENPNETLIYNISVLHFKNQNYSKVVLLLSELFKTIETVEENLILKICFLLLEVYLSQNDIKESHRIVNYLETNFKSILLTETDEITKNFSNFNLSSSKILLNYYKNRFYILCEKFDQLKNISCIPLMEAHIKSLNDENTEGMKILIDNKLEIDPFVYFNNLGYLAVKMNKLNLSLFYLNQSLKKSKSNNIVSQHYYNTGLILMNSNRFKEAFDNFIRSYRCMSRNPKFWVHLAECCIEEYSQKNLEKKIILIHKNNELDLIKLPIPEKSDNYFHFTQDSFEMNLQMSVKYLLNAIYLIDNIDPNITLIYLKLAHVSLLINNPIMVLTYCKKVFSSGSIQLKSLAYSYCIKAICLIENSNVENYFPNQTILKEIIENHQILSGDILETVFINTSLFLILKVFLDQILTFREI